MSGFTPVAITRFRAALRARGLGLGELAKQAGTSRAYLSQVLWSHFYSPETWSRIRACVTPPEWAELLHVENCATWNTRAEAQAARCKDVFLIRVVCAWCDEPQGFKACAHSEPGAVTHSLCPSCLAVNFPGIKTRGAAVAHPHLVRTEAGLQVHHSKTVPALADRELAEPGDARTATITCADNLSPAAR